MRHRFFVPAGMIAGDRVTFTAEQQKQIKSVLRLRPGDIVSVSDGSGREFDTEIAALDEKCALGRILDVRHPASEPKVRLTLVQSLPKGERIGLILQKCTEIGAAEFLIVETSRTIPRIPAAKMASRLDRWRAITREAAEQSGRTYLPAVHGVIPFEDALQRAKSCGKRFIAWEEQRGSNLASAVSHLGDTREIALFIGPEGGFAPDEIEAAKAAGVIPISLGPRTLRTETAAIVGTALIIYGLEG